MKRGAVLILAIVFLSSFVIASDVAYVLKRPSNSDAGFMEIFNEMGLEVDLIDDKDIRNTNFSEYKFIFVGNERIRNVRYLPINNYPSVIANGYYGKLFGLLDKRRLSKLVASSPLKIKENPLIQVYIASTFKLGGIGIPYYYLPYKYKNENMETIATTAIGYNIELGDVISYSKQEPNKCFFGITKTKFWTEDAKNLFRDCVEFVIGETEEEEPAPECIEDIECGEIEIVNECLEGNLQVTTNVPVCIEGGCGLDINEEIIECEFGCVERECREEDGEPQPIIYYCEDKDETRECPYGISGGKGTRCYKTEEVSGGWYSCSSGWVEI